MKITGRIVLLWESFYFSRWRNKGTMREVLAIPGGVALSCTALAVAIDHSTLVDRVLRHLFYAPWFKGGAYAVIGFFFVWVYLRFAPYKWTNMMLRADGKGCWSVHMAGAVSMVPFLYALTRRDLIHEGEMAILEGAWFRHLRGRISLESHLYGDPEAAKRKIEKLHRRFPDWRYDATVRETPLGSLNAFWLNCLRLCLFSRINLQRWWARWRNKSMEDGIPLGQGRLYSDTPVGTITITIS